MAVIEKATGRIVAVGVVDATPRAAYTHYHDGDSVFDGFEFTTWNRAEQREEHALVRWTGARSAQAFLEVFEAAADATESDLREWAAYITRRDAEANASRGEAGVEKIAEYLQSPRVGFLATAKKGRKVPVGTVGLVLWVGEKSYGGRSTWQAMIATSVEKTTRNIVGSDGKLRSVDRYLHTASTASANLVSVGSNLAEMAFAAAAWHEGYDGGMAADYVSSEPYIAADVLKLIRARWSNYEASAVIIKSEGYEEKMRALVKRALGDRFKAE